MSPTPSEDALDRLNAWRDGQDVEPPSPELKAQLEAAEAELKRAFDPSRAQQFVFSRLHDVTQAEQANTMQTSTRSVPRPMVRWMGLVAASVVLGLLTIFVLREKQSDNETRYAQVTPVAAYDRAVASGMKPTWVCTVEEAPQRISHHFENRPFTLAAVPTDVSFLGWTGPYRTQQQVLEPRELVLLTRVDEKPATLVVGLRDRTSDVPSPATRDDVHVHVRTTQDYVLVETSPFAEPRLLPLVNLK